MGPGAILLPYALSVLSSTVLLGLFQVYDMYKYMTRFSFLLLTNIFQKSVSTIF